MGIRRRFESWLPWQRRRVREEDLERELRSHLDLEAEEQREASLSSEEAAYAARRALGNTARIKEDVRTAWGHQWLETLLQDLRYGLRQLRRSPGFSAAAILIAALGIAATCIVFSFAEAAVFRALPYRNPSSLVGVAMTNPKAPDEGAGVSIPVLLSWRKHAKQIGQFAARGWENQTLVGGSEPKQVSGETISRGGIRILGVHPVLGRLFSPADYKVGSPPVAILSFTS